jgi:hypothetical protein
MSWIPGNFQAVARAVLSLFEAIEKGTIDSEMVDRHKEALGAMLKDDEAGNNADNCAEEG